MAKIKRTDSSLAEDSYTKRRALMKKRKKRRRQRILLAVAVPLIVLISVSVYLAFTLFKVDTVIAEGSSRYSSEEIIQAAGIAKGSNLLRLSSSDVAARAEKKLPYLGSIKVKKVLPNKIKLTAEDTFATSALLYGDKLYVLSGELKVLEELPVSEAAMRLPVFGGGIPEKQPAAGEKIKYADPLLSKIHIDILKALADNNLLENIQYVDVSDKLAIKLQYDRRLVVLAGDYLDLNTKYAYAKSIIAKLSATDMGYIDVPNAKKGSFQPGGEEILLYPPKLQQDGGAAVAGA